MPQLVGRPYLSGRTFTRKSSAAPVKDGSGQLRFSIQSIQGRANRATLVFKVWPRKCPSTCPSDAIRCLRKDRLSRAALFEELFVVRQIVAGPPEPSGIAFMRPCIFNWLQTFLEDCPLAFNLHLFLSGDSLRIIRWGQIHYTG